MLFNFISRSRKHFQYITKLLRALNINIRRKLSFVTVFAIFLATFEMITVWSFAPFFSVLIDAESLRFKFNEYFNILLFENIIHFQFSVILGFGLIIFVNAVLRLLYLHYSSKAVYSAATDISKLIFQKTLYLPFVDHLRNNSSVFVVNVNSRASIVLDVMNSLITLVSSSFIFIALMVLLLIGQPPSVIISLCLIALFYVVIAYLNKRKLSKNSIEGNIIADQIQKVLQESFKSIKDIILRSSHNEFVEAFAKKILVVREIQRTNYLISTYPRFVVEGLALIIVAGLAALMIHKGNETALISLATLGILSLRILPALQAIYGAITHLRGHWNLFTSAIDFLSYEANTKYSPANHKFVESVKVKSIFKESIQLQNVSFGYSGYNSIFLRNVNISIKKGDIIGVVGETGQGKSTLINLLMGLLEPSRGKILVDGVPLQSDNIHIWRQSIAHVPQHIELLDSDIQSNIAFTLGSLSKKQKQRVVECIKVSRLSVQNLTTIKLLSHNVGEGGGQLSGGQKQRLGIARAIFTNAPILIFDEATSALDQKTEDAVIANLEKYCKDRTVFLVTHKISTLKMCNKVIEVTKGTCLVHDKI